MGARPGNYLITGISCSGKTTVIGELARRNFNAYSTDEMPEVSGFFDRLTGNFLPVGEQPPKAEAVDFGRYAWYWRPDGLTNLLSRPRGETLDKPVINFIGASVMNQYDDDVFGLFDKTFLLVVDREALTERIVERANNPESTNKYGARPNEMERILSLHTERQNAALVHGAIPIVATRPVNEIADSILSYMQS